MNELTHLSLFSGIGGLDLAAEWAGFRTVGQCEWADYPTKALEKHWPDVPRWRDIRTLTGESFYERTGLHTVDIISGGFPCQPFSVAGKRRGKEDDRFLWPEMVRVIQELRPTWVVGENVAGIVRMALPDILSELEACGYRTRTFLIPACAVGARHRRYRVAIVGHSNHNGGRTPGNGNIGERKKSNEGREEQPQYRLGGPGEIMANAKSIHEGRLPVREEQKKPGFIGSSENVADTKSKGERGLSVQPGRPRQENPNVEWSGEDVQHSNYTGCKQQHISAKPDQKGFPGGGYNAGNVSDTDGGTDLRREPCQRAFGQDADGWDHIGAGKEEHAEWKRRPAQSGMDGVADGISDWVDQAIDYLEENAGDLADDDDYLEWYWNDFIIDHYWDAEPDIPRVAAGIPDRVSRLKALGNAVVPQQFYLIFKSIAEIERRLEQSCKMNTDSINASGIT